ncbi:MAG: S66 peptidase family protein [Chroococcales cyanobacterium]
MAVYEDREAFIPYRRTDLIELCIEDGQLSRSDIPKFREFCSILSAYYHFQFHSTLESLKDNYETFNPDADSQPIITLNRFDQRQMTKKVVKTFSALVSSANYIRLSKKDLRKAFEEESLIELKTDVDFADFEEMACFYRGNSQQIIKEKKWFREVEREIKIFERVALLIKFREKAYFTKRKIKLEKLNFKPSKMYVYLYNSSKNIGFDVGMLNATSLQISKIFQSSKKKKALVQFNNLNRRYLLKLLGLTLLATQLPASAKDSTIKPQRLQIGDTVGLVNPASIIDQQDLETAKKALTDLGLKVKVGNHVLNRYGYLAGKDSDRAADINTMFADNTIKALIAIRGGWGCNRILPLLDYSLIRHFPKIVMGYSDITSLLLAIYAKTGMMTFHGPVATSTWNAFTINSLKPVLFEGKRITLSNLNNTPIETIYSGKTTGNLIGGNLSVLTAMVGSSYLPNFNQGILFVEEIGEDVYRVDRMLTQLKLAGILDQLSGFIFASCRNCTAGEDGEPSLSLKQVLFDHIAPLRIPAWYGSMMGHIADKFTIPVGIVAEIDADRGTIQLLESAVY